MVLGGWGLVGTAVCRRLYHEKPASIIVASMHRREAEAACKIYESEAPDIKFQPFGAISFCVMICASGGVRIYFRIP